MRRTILFLAYDGITALDLIGPMQVFATASGHGEARDGVPLYDLSIASIDGGPIRASGGLELVTTPLSQLAIDAVDTVIVPGGGDACTAAAHAPLIHWLVDHGGRVRRLCSVCVGAFHLGRAGLLDGRKVTTHWRFADALQEDFPRAEVQMGPIFVRDGPLWSSAGVSAGIDLALHLVEEDAGRKLAMDVAKTLVVYLRRPGDQHQFSAALALQSSADPEFAALLSWAGRRLDKDLSVEALAERMNMTPRTFARKFRAAVGRTPATTIESLRLEAARRLLEEGDMPLKRIASAAGLVDEQGLRRVFVRLIGVTPSAYRQRFR